MAVNPQLAQQFEKQRQKKLREINLRKNASEVKKDLQKKNFGGSLNEFNKFYSNLKKTNPQLAQRIQKPSDVKKDLDNRIKQIDSAIKRAQERLEDARKDERRAKDRDDERREDRAEAEQDRYRTEKRELEKFKKRLQKGEILSVSEIRNFANDKGRAEERQERAKAKAKRRAEEQREKVIAKAKEGLKKQLGKDAKYLDEGITFTEADKKGVDLLSVIEANRKLKEIEKSPTNKIVDVANSKIKDLSQDIKRRNNLKEGITASKIVTSYIDRPLPVNTKKKITPSQTVFNYINSPIKPIKQETPSQVVNNYINSLPKPDAEVFKRDKQLQKKLQQETKQELNFIQKLNLEPIRTALSELKKSTVPFLRERYKQIQKNVNVLKNLKPSDIERAVKKINADLKELNLLDKGKKKAEELGLSIKDYNSKKFNVVSNKINATPSTVIQATNDIIPLVNDDARSGIKKFLRNEKLTTREKIQISLDAVTVGAAALLLTRRGSGAAAAGGTVITRNRILTALFGNSAKQSSNSVIKKNFNKVVDKIIKASRNDKGIPKRSLLIAPRFLSSVAVSVGAVGRIQQSAEELYQIDNNFLDQQAKKVGVENNRKLLNVYTGFVNEELKDSKLSVGDVTNFIGVSAASRKTISKAQKEFEKYLEQQGISKANRLKILAQIEGKRKSLVISEILGALKTEIDSEKLARKLIEKGSSKTVSVGTAGIREGIAILGQQAYIQDYEVSTGDFLLALLGAPTSVWFSKSKFKKIKDKDLNKGLNTISKNIYNKANPTQKTKITRKGALKLKDVASNDISNTQLAKNINKLSQKEKSQLGEQYIKYKIFSRRKQMNAKKAKTLLRDPVANVLDPFEYPGELILDTKEAIVRRIARKIGIEVKPKSNLKKVRGLSVAKSTSKSKGKATSKSKSRVASKTKAKGKSQAKATSKTKGKSKTKSKTKTKAKSKTKSKSKTKTKTKTKAKSKTKSKAKTKVKTITLPKLPKTSVLENRARNHYKIEFKRDGKKAVSQKDFPLNIALARAKRINQKEVSLLLTSRKKAKDIKKPELKDYKIQKLRNSVKVIKK